MMGAIKNNVDIAMEAWCRWARAAFAGIGWPPESLLSKIIRYGVRGAAQKAGLYVSDADELCELVDRGLLRLADDQRAVIVRHYMYHETQDVSAKMLSMGHARFRDLLYNARNRMHDFLEGARESLGLT
jgi:DNA-directed RNA polymerase specialized sigma24 family protein